MACQDTERLTQIVLGAFLSRTLCTVADLCIADHIPPGSPASAAHLARVCGCNEQALFRALRLLASHGVFRETSDGRFEHSAASRALRTGAEGSFRAGGLLFHRLFELIDDLDHTIRTGEPAPVKAYGKSLFEHVAEQPELAPIFDAGMTSFHHYETAAMLKAYDFSGIGVLADIGGGNGSLITAVLRRYPQMRGILFDLGHVLARTRESAAVAALADRCRLVEGSFFESVPSGADAYLLRHVLHDWTDAQCRTILRNCRSAIGGNGKLIIVECVVPPGNGRSISKDYDVLMMTVPGGLERTEAQFRSLLAESGFRQTSITPTSAMISVIEGEPAPEP